MPVQRGILFSCAVHKSYHCKTHLMYNKKSFEEARERLALTVNDCRRTGTILDETRIRFIEKLEDAKKFLEVAAAITQRKLS